MEAVGTVPARRFTRQREALVSLEVRDFRLLWLNSLAFFLSRSMGMVTVGWLVKELTDSPSMVGLAFFAQGMPMALLVLPAGVWADRMDRRWLILLSQAATTAFILALTALIFADAVATWSVLALSVGIGAAQAIGVPSRQAVVPALVGPGRLMNAIALSNMIQNLSFVVGPAIAGLTLKWLDFEGAFVIQTGLLLIGLPWLLAMRSAPMTSAGEERPAIIRQVGDGLAYIAGSKLLRSLFVIAAFTGLFFLGSFQALMPVFADDVLDVGDLGLGIMSSMFGVGTFLGTVFIVSRKEMQRKGEVLLVSLAGGSMVFLAFAFSEVYGISLLMLALWGVGAAFFMNLTSTLIQSRTPNDVMGRVMSVQALSFFGVSPIGALVAGGVADTFSAQVAATVGAIAVGVMAIWFLARDSELRSAG